MVAEAGCVLAALQQEARAAGRYFPLSLSAEGSCQIGGNLATNAGGINVLRYGTARQQVLGLEVVLADGSIIDGLRSLRKDTAGYDLKQLFIGSEGTLGVCTKVAVRLTKNPVAVRTLLLSFDSVADAATTVSEIIAAAGIPQWAGAETQKFGHITYFWNGNRTGTFDEVYEEYVEIPSDTLPFDERPWMKAAEITDAVIDTIRSGKYKFIRLNYANGDMVGHTGVPVSIRIAVETVDLCLGRLLRAVRDSRGVAMVTADHGNADRAQNRLRQKPTRPVLAKASRTRRPLRLCVRYAVCWIGCFEFV